MQPILDGISWDLVAFLAIMLAMAIGFLWCVGLVVNGLAGLLALHFRKLDEIRDALRERDR